MGGNISALVSGKVLYIVKICADPDNEEKKDYDKPSKTFDYHNIIENYTMEAAGKNLQATILSDQTIFSIDHFDSVPSPPPDYIA